MRRTVSCSLSAQILEPASVELQVAVAGPRPTAEELLVTLDGRPVAVEEVRTEAGGRMHLADVGTGWFSVTYRAEPAPVSAPAAVTPLEASSYLRPSRYAESDRLGAVAAAEFGHLRDHGAVVQAVSDWVHDELAYISGSSRGTDGAVDTHLSKAGVCRDYAHLALALLRARDVPSRLVSVYAPGLSPMDFHAVVEALVDGAWRVVDPTRLAPRGSLVRIATGRDAADTAFLSTYGGDVRFAFLEVTATTEGDLPIEDLGAVVHLA